MGPVIGKRLIRTALGPLLPPSPFRLSQEIQGRPIGAACMCSQLGKTRGRWESPLSGRSDLEGLGYGVREAEVGQVKGGLLGVEGSRTTVVVGHM